MDYAQEIGAKYVVFHVSNVSILETLTRKFDYSDKEVIEATIDLVNQLFTGKDYDFEFLLENLPWPGLNFSSANLAKRLLKEIKYKKTDFILDAGHMMQNKLDIFSPEEGVEYIYSWFMRNKDLIPHVRGMHIHQSISGEYMKESMKKEVNLEKDFNKRFAQAYEYVFKVDRHEVLEANNSKKLVDLIQPEYLVYEYRSIGREDREEKLVRQYNEIFGSFD